VTSGVSFIGGIKGSTPRGAAIMWRDGYHMIDTTDASRVYFEAQPNGDCNGYYALYVRNRETETTTLIDPAEREDVAFIRATPDGRHAYFATKSQLDPADKNDDVDVYRWSEDTGESTCLTCVVPDAEIENEFRNRYTPLLVSNDFSHIYFESLKQLVPGYGTEGQQNLYALVNGSLQFVSQTYGFQPLATAALSDDGNVLTFLSEGERSVTADEIGTCTASGSGTSQCTELYRYDDRDGSVECLSCVEEGTTEKEVGDGETLAGLQMSRDGATVAFVTGEALAPGDVNRKPDVYEWRNGVRQLVTDGITEFVSGPLAGPHVRGMDASGSNIFFSVADPGLTGFEQDGLANLYDARIGGGFVPPSPPGHCVEDSCQGPLQAAPPEVHPDTASYAGPGNVPARRRCAGLSHRSHKRRVQVKRVLNHARRLASSNGRQAETTRKQAARVAKRAERLSKRAKRCLHGKRRSGR
jgi:hypothetical protein